VHVENGDGVHWVWWSGPSTLWQAHFRSRCQEMRQASTIIHLEAAPDNELQTRTPTTHTPAMRLSVASWLLAAGPAIVSASAAAGQVFLYDAEAAPQRTSEPIDPATARLILAQRLDLSQFHSIADADDEAIRLVNAYGGQTQQLFGWGNQDESRSMVMIVVEGVQDPISMHTLYDR
jgi:hypothetical protein